MGLLVLLGIVAYVVLEWFVASWLSGYLGWGGVFLLVALLVILGAAVMRRAGWNALRSMRPVEVDGVNVAPAMTEERVGQVGRDVGDAGLLFVAGLLIAVPGLVTSVVGLVMLIKPVRRALARGVSAWARRRAERSGLTMTRVTSTTVDGVTVVREDVVGGDAARPVRGEIVSGDVIPGEVVDREPDQPS